MFVQDMHSQAREVQLYFTPKLILLNLYSHLTFSDQHFGVLTISRMYYLQTECIVSQITTTRYHWLSLSNQFS